MSTIQLVTDRKTVALMQSPFKLWTCFKCSESNPNYFPYSFPSVGSQNALPRVHDSDDRPVEPKQLCRVSIQLRDYLFVPRVSSDWMEFPGGIWNVPLVPNFGVGRGSSPRLIMAIPVEEFGGVDEL